jgi:DNA-directed RNA polymerase specialized sigma24 family protein
METNDSQSPKKRPQEIPKDIWHIICKLGNDWEKEERDEVWKWIGDGTYFDKLTKRAYGICGNLDNADDIVCDVLIEFFTKGFEKYDPTRHAGNGCPLLNRLRSLVHYKALDYLKIPENNQKHRISLPPDDPSNQGAILVNRTDDATIFTDEILSLFPPVDRLIAEKHVLEGLTFPEIAGESEMNNGTVRQRWNRATKKVKEQINPSDNPPNTPQKEVKNNHA